MHIFLVSGDRNYWNQVYHLDFHVLDITENQLKFASSQYWKAQRWSLIHLYTYMWSESISLFFPLFNELCFWCVCPFVVPACLSAAQALGLMPLDPEGRDECFRSCRGRGLDICSFLHSFGSLKPIGLLSYVILFCFIFIKKNKWLRVTVFHRRPSRLANLIPPCGGDGAPVASHSFYTSHVTSPCQTGVKFNRVIFPCSLGYGFTG